MLTVQTIFDSHQKDILLSDAYASWLTDVKPLFRRRTNLFIPMNKIERFAKHIHCGTDAVIFDLEDSVPSGTKPLARQNLLLLPKRSAKIEYIIRVNGFETTDFELDLEALQTIADTFDTIWIPKIESTQAIEVVRNTFPNHTIGARCETPLGINNAFLTAEALVSGDSMGFGAGDFCMCFGIQRMAIYENYALMHAASHVASAAHQYNIDFIDVITRDFGNLFPNGPLVQEAQWAADNLGAIGKAVIHPAQVESVNQVFTPTFEHIHAEVEILNTFAEMRHHRAIRTAASNYAGTPSYKTALHHLRAWQSKGFIQIGETAA
ncbi:MAG: hypothetical protein GY801_26615 [bacterium]|nr:hypothetical protein [bacterium]